MDEVTYTVHIETAEEGGFVASFPALPGCQPQGETFDEVVAMDKDALMGFLETLRTPSIWCCRRDEAEIWMKIPCWIFGLRIYIECRKHLFLPNGRLSIGSFEKSRTSEPGSSVIPQIFRLMELRHLTAAVMYHLGETAFPRWVHIFYDASVTNKNR